MNAAPTSSPLSQLATGADNFQTCQFSQTQRTPRVFSLDFLNGSERVSDDSKSKSNTRVASLSTSASASASALRFVVCCNTIVISCPAETLQEYAEREESREGTKNTEMNVSMCVCVSVWQSVTQRYHKPKLR